MSEKNPPKTKENCEFFDDFDEKTLRENLEKLVKKDDENYAKFNAKIVNSRKEFLGIRTPDLRNFAKNLSCKIYTFSQIFDFLKMINSEIYEEVSVAGFLIFCAKISADEKIKLTEIYLEKVDNWAQIDSFVMSFEKEKFAGKIDENLREKYWNFALKNLKSDKEFFARHGIMILFSNFLTSEKIAEVFEKIREIPSLKNVKNSEKSLKKSREKLEKNSAKFSAKNVEKYYVKMAAAWLFAEAAINFFDETLSEMKNEKIDIWTRKKALAKMLESRRFSDEKKQKIRDLRDEISAENL